jgi:hypothetical protein
MLQNISRKKQQKISRIELREEYILVVLLFTLRTFVIMSVFRKHRRTSFIKRRNCEFYVWV